MDMEMRQSTVLITLIVLIKCSFCKHDAMLRIANYRTVLVIFVVLMKRNPGHFKPSLLWPQSVRSVEGNVRNIFGKYSPKVRNAAALATNCLVPRLYHFSER